MRWTESPEQMLSETGNNSGFGLLTVIFTESVNLHPPGSDNLTVYFVDCTGAATGFEMVESDKPVDGCQT